MYAIIAREKFKFNNKGIMEQNEITDGRAMAIISYIFTPIGLLVAFLMNNEKRNAYAHFHIGQSFRLALLALANYILGLVLPRSLSMITTFIGLGILGLMILGIVTAAKGKITPLPIIGTLGGHR